MVLRFSGDKVHNQMISSKAVNFKAEILNLVNFFVNLVILQKKQWQHCPDCPTVKGLGRTANCRPI